MWLDKKEKICKEIRNLYLMPSAPETEMECMIRVIRELVKFVDNHPCEFSNCPYEENLSEDIKEILDVSK
jgi:hypothetical protein